MEEEAEARGIPRNNMAKIIIVDKNDNPISLKERERLTQRMILAEYRLFDYKLPKSSSSGSKKAYQKI